MLINNHITAQLIQITHSNDITQYKNVIIVEVFLQKDYVTYQRKGNQELQIQALDNIVADLQNQINNFTFAGSDPNEPIIATS